MSDQSKKQKRKARLEYKKALYAYYETTDPELRKKYAEIIKNYESNGKKDGYKQLLLPLVFDEHGRV